MRRSTFVLLGVALVLTVGILSFADSASNDTPNLELTEPAATCPVEELDPTGETLSFRPIPFPIPPSTCGGNVCGPGQYCCNASCGTCVNFGDYCTQEYCPPTS